jgi:drug/metabolite transporter (DMT)-like permease
MEPPLPEIVAWRLALAALPFVVWFVWRAWAQRTGRPMGSTPWSWLFAAGAMLVGLSLIATAVFHRDNRHEAYVPAQATSDGSVSTGYFEKGVPASPNPAPPTATLPSARK